MSASLLVDDLKEFKEFKESKESKDLKKAKEVRRATRKSARRIHTLYNELATMTMPDIMTITEDGVDVDSILTEERLRATLDNFNQVRLNHIANVRAAKEFYVILAELLTMIDLHRTL